MKVTEHLERYKGKTLFSVEILPPLRQPNLLKYLAGPEIGGGNFLSDTSAEEKAEELRAQSSVHYKRARAVERSNEQIHQR